jgi:hypothetical protein
MSFSKLPAHKHHAQKFPQPSISLKSSRSQVFCSKVPLPYAVLVLEHHTFFEFQNAQQILCTTLNMSLFTSEQKTPLNLQSVLSDPANLIFLTDLMDERIKVKKETERRRMESRTGTSIDDASGFQSTNSSLTSSSQRSSEKNNKANELNTCSFTK